MLNEYLIEQIRSHTCLYNQSLSIYKDHITKNNGWDDINHDINYFGNRTRICY